jgi:hypothetical protein
VSWPELRAIIQDRFVDHPKLPAELRPVVPLQEVRLWLVSYAFRSVAWAAHT